MRTTAHMVAVVEDDPAMRKSLERLLRVNGYTTTALSSAEEFLQSGVGDYAIALILDIHLGGMSGIELRRRLLAAGSQLPVIYITASRKKDLKQIAIEEGAAGFFEKPYDAEELLSCIARILGAERPLPQTKSTWNSQLQPRNEKYSSGGR